MNKITNIGPFQERLFKELFVNIASVGNVEGIKEYRKINDRGKV